MIALLLAVQLHADLGLHLQVGLSACLLTVAPSQALIGPASWDMVAQSVPWDIKMTLSPVCLQVYSPGGE